MDDDLLVTIRNGIARYIEQHSVLETPVYQAGIGVVEIHRQNWPRYLLFHKHTVTEDKGGVCSGVNLTEHATGVFVCTYRDRNQSIGFQLLLVQTDVHDSPFYIAASWPLLQE